MFAYRYLKVLGHPDGTKTWVTSAKGHLCAFPTFLFAWGEARYSIVIVNYSII